MQHTHKHERTRVPVFQHKHNTYTTQAFYFILLYSNTKTDLMQQTLPHTTQNWSDTTQCSLKATQKFPNATQTSKTILTFPYRKTNLKKKHTHKNLPIEMRRKQYNRSSAQHKKSSKATETSTNTQQSFKTNARQSFSGTTLRQHSKELRTHSEAQHSTWRNTQIETKKENN